jgi:AcrR family transcriptional regulator
MTEARVKILKAAAALFAGRGFHGTTTRAIAKKAAVNEGTVFKIFGNKRRLYRETLEWKLHELTDRSLPAQSPEPHDLVKHVIEAREQDPYIMRLILFGALEALPEFKKVLHAWRRDYYSRLGAIVEQQKAHGTVAEDVPSMFAAVTLTGFAIYHYLFFDIFKIDEDIPISRNELTEFYYRLWRDGLASDIPRNGKRTEEVTEAPEGGVLACASFEKFPA